MPLVPTVSQGLINIIFTSFMHPSPYYGDVGASIVTAFASNQPQSAAPGMAAGWLALQPASVVAAAASPRPPRELALGFAPAPAPLHLAPPFLATAASLPAAAAFPLLPSLATLGVPRLFAPPALSPASSLVPPLALAPGGTQRERASSPTSLPQARPPELCVLALLGRCAWRWRVGGVSGEKALESPARRR